MQLLTQRRVVGPYLSVGYAGLALVLVLVSPFALLIAVAACWLAVAGHRRTADGRDLYRLAVALSAAAVLIALFVLAGFQTSETSVDERPPQRVSD